MNTTEPSTTTAEATSERRPVDTKLEVVVLPVSDVDRAKDFYVRLGWRLDADVGGGDFRLLQFNPPGSGCSIQFGSGLTTSAPGSSVNLLVVSDIEAAEADLTTKGIETSGVFHDSTGGFNRFDAGVRARGPDPERRSYASFMEFSDPVPSALNSAASTSALDRVRLQRAMQ